MRLSRRNLLAGMGAVTAATSGAVAAQTALAQSAGAPPPASGAPTFPRKADFVIEDGFTFLNAAYTHPIPRVALEAARRAIDNRNSLQPRRRREDPEPPDPKALFAELIGARPTEIAYVPSTSFGENLVVQSLGLHRSFEGNVVSDGLHFEGALMHLLELKRKGLDVRIIRPTEDGRIDMREMERAINRRTRLVEVSSVAMYNGFQHDLRAISEIAHAHGAFVYADIIHSAGVGPFDVAATGVDFAACSTFKWLMGDFGIGFLYAREDVRERIERPVIGYYESSEIEAFYPPNLTAGEYRPVAYGFADDAAGMFEPGTLADGVAGALATASLGYIKDLGLENIQAHRRPLIARLQEELPRLGFAPMTPPNSASGHVTFAKRDLFESDLPDRLEAANVNVRLSRHWLRISPSVYNDMQDIERLLGLVHK